MIVVDSSAVVAVMFDEDDAERFRRAMVGAAGCLMSAVSLLEASMVIAGDSRASDPWARLDSLMSEIGLNVVAHDRALAVAAREAFLRFGKGRHPARLNLGDCASYALAKTRNLPLLFKGGDFTRTDLISAL